MKILVLLKEVPDTWGDRKIALDTGLADRASSDPVPDEITERALEVALSYADSDDAEIVVLSMGPESAAPSIRKALGMGADRGIHVTDPALAGADARTTAEVLATALRAEGFDLIITGNSSTDGSTGIVPAAIAELLSIPLLSAMTSVEFDESTVKGTRAVEGGVQTVSAPLPALVSVTDALPDPRFPNFKGISAAKKKPIDQSSLSELSITLDENAVPQALVLSVAERPARAAGVKITDDGTAGQQLAAYLFDNNLAG